MNRRRRDNHDNYATYVVTDVSDVVMIIIVVNKRRIWRKFPIRYIYSNVKAHSIEVMWNKYK